MLICAAYFFLKWVSHFFKIFTKVVCFPKGVRQKTPKNCKVIPRWMADTWFMLGPLRWRHNERYDVSNHQPLDCLLNRLFKHRSKKTSKLPSLAFVSGIHRWPVNSPHRGPVTRTMFPFDDVITQSVHNLVIFTMVSFKQVYTHLDILNSMMCEMIFQRRFTLVTI